MVYASHTCNATAGIPFEYDERVCVCEVKQEYNLWGLGDAMFCQFVYVVRYMTSADVIHIFGLGRIHSIAFVG